MARLELDPSVVGYTVCEFYGKGDGYFGGTADDRPLGKSGQFLRGCYSLADIAEFDSRCAALAAAGQADKRPGGRIGVVPIRQYE